MQANSVGYLETQTKNVLAMSQREADSSTPIKLCFTCHEPIPVGRLKAVPNARLCRPCQEAAGDVPLLRRFDEHTPDGTIETMFIRDKRLESAILRSKFRSADDDSYNAAVGDDSHLEIERCSTVAASSLSKEISTEEEILERTQTESRRVQ